MQKLTLGGVFMDASPEMKLVMLGLIAALLGAVAVWVLGVMQARRGDAQAAAGAINFLKGVRMAAPLFGFTAASYVFLMGWLGVSNVPVTPGLKVLAPGYAEATFLIFLGLFAAAVAAVAERHVEGRVRHAALSV